MKTLLRILTAFYVLLFLLFLIVGAISFPKSQEAPGQFYLVYIIETVFEFIASALSFTVAYGLWNRKRWGLVVGIGLNLVLIIVIGMALVSAESLQTDLKTVLKSFWILSLVILSFITILLFWPKFRRLLNNSNWGLNEG